MSQTLTIPDTPSAHLEQIAHMHGFARIDQLLEEWQAFVAQP